MASWSLIVGKASAAQLEVLHDQRRKETHPDCDCACKWISLSSRRRVLSELHGRSANAFPFAFGRI